MPETTITDLPDAAALTGAERVPMDQAGATVDATTQAIADLADADPAGTAAAAVTAHEGEADPHPDYALADGSRGAFATLAQGALADSATQPGDLAAVAVSGAYGDLTGEPSIPSTPGDVGAEPAGTAAAAVTAHEAAADPHPDYALEANLGTAAAQPSSAFATSAQGALADSATQPGDLATVATTGAYGDLSGKPSLGTAAAQDIGAFATSAQGTLADSAVQPGDLAAVATTGAYGDLTGRPSLGTAAAQDVGAFATSAQGALAGSAVQPGDLAAVATSGAYGDLTGEPSLGTAAPLDVGTGAGTVAAGDDSRLTSAMLTVNHGSNASTARPSAPFVYWVGTVEPDNAIDGDLGSGWTPA